jgi:predicted nuclease of predicted toxin-antitoxin system
MPSVRLLREAGHEVAVIARDSPGAPDEEVLLRAHRENRVLLTFDRDHGRLIYESSMPVPAGVVYFRLVPLTLEEPAERLMSLLEEPGLAIMGKLTVVERDRLRQRDLIPPG